METADLLREIHKLQEGQKALLDMVAAKELTVSREREIELEGVDLGRIYRTQGDKAFRAALKAQNRRRLDEYRRRGIAV